MSAGRTRVLTPLGKVFYGRTILTRSGKTRREKWAAVSACGQWYYERLEEIGTPWVVTFMPTGQEERFGSLPKARRWTASPDAVPALRRDAQRVIDAGGVNRGRVWPPQTEQECEVEAEAARRIVEIIDGLTGEPGLVEVAAEGERR